MMKKNFLSTNFLNWRTSLVLLFFLTAFSYGQSDCGTSGTLCYSNNLSNFALGSWEADASNDLITIEFTSGGVESCCDFFTVYEGVGTSGNVIGSNVTGSLTGRSFTATGAITVAATSDSSVSCGSGSASTPTANFTISCSAPPSCPVPANVLVSEITSSGGQINWDFVTEAVDGYQWLLVPEGEPVFDYIDGGITTSSVNSATFSSLTPNTPYDIYVRALCGMDGVSDYSVVNFTTTPDFCGGDNFFDSGGASGNYGNNENITTVISPDTPGDVVTVTFLSFNTEENWDSLAIYNGPDTSFPIFSSGSTVSKATVPVGAWHGTGAFSADGESFTSTHPSGSLTFVFRSDGSGTRSGWEAEVTCAPPPTCFPSANLAVSNITNESVDLSWDAEATAADGYEWAIMPLGEAANPGTAVASTTTTFLTESVSGLAANTSYSAYVRSECGPGDVSAWSNAVNFTTLCNAVADFTEDFESTALGEMPDCWNTIINVPGGFPSIEVGSEFGPAPMSETPADFTSLSSNRVEMRNGSNLSGDIIAVAPRVSNLGNGTQWLTFSAGASNASNNLIIGTLTDPNDPSTFTAFETVDLTTLATSFQVNFSSYSGTDNFIGFKRELTTTFSNVYFDNVVWEVAPTCFPPNGLSVANISSTVADLSWDTNPDAGEGYEWVVMAEGVAADVTSAVATGTTTATMAEVTALSPETDYSAYVRSVCSIGDESAWTEAVDFSTTVSCASPTNITAESPYGFAGEFNWDASLTATDGYEWGVYLQGQSPLVGDTPVDSGTVVAGTTGFDITSLDPDTGYLFFIRSICDTGVFSDWTGVLFATGAGCPIITGYDVTNITSSSAVLSWSPSANPSATDYNWRLVPTGVNPEVAGEQIASGTVGASGPFEVTITGLDPNTTYDFNVRYLCVSEAFSDVGDVITFSTECAAFALNFEEEFADFGGNINTTSASECWAEGTGFFDTVVNGQWGEQNFVNQVSHPNGRSLYVNLYSSSPRQDWVTTPAIDLGSGSPDYVLSYDVYAAPWTNPATAQLTSFGNHSVEVYISTDFGNTWTDLLTTYDNSNNPNDINDTEEVFSLASYTDEVMIGFLAKQDGTSVDIRFYIDNLFVGTPPTCFPPDISSSTASATQISTDWPAEATATDGYNWFLMAAGENPVDDTPIQTGNVTTNALTVSGLTPNTAYDIYVQSDCGSGDLSTFTVLSRTTPALEATPWTEGFNGTTNPIGWNISGWTRGTLTSSGGIEGRDGSAVIRRNLFGTGASQNGFIETVNVGPIQAGDYLSYEYNVKNFGTQAPNPVPAGACTFMVTGSFSTSGAVILQSFTSDDKLGWQKKYIDLSDYVGETVQINIAAARNAGDLWLYFDNFAIKNIENYVYVDDATGWVGDPSSGGPPGPFVEIAEGSTSFEDSKNLSELIVFAQASLDIEDVLNLNGELYTDGEVTFKSSATLTGQLASASQIRGQVTTERFVPAGTNVTRGFRFITPTVDGGSMFNNWQEGGNSPAGFGTHITGSTSGANGFDATITGNPSLFVFDNTAPTQAGGIAWVAATNTTDNLIAGTPYRIFVRGDRNIVLTEANPTPNNTVLRAKGNLVVGNRTTATFASDDLQFSFFGNPYQAIVNLNNVTFNGDVNSNYAYVWDINSGTSGSYVTVEISSGTNTMSSNASNLLQPGQAVFIRNNSSVTTAPSIEFTEISKQVFGSQLTTFATPEYSVVNVQLISPNHNGLVLDGIGMRFDDSFNNAVGDEDAGKIGNSGENMAIVRSNQLLSIERRNYPFQGESHQLFVNNLQQQTYALKLMTENYTSDLDVIVVDNYLGTETLITEGNDYMFTAQPNVPESISPFRFELKFDIISLGNENQLAQNISLYPVPVSNVLNIQYINDSKLSVEVINLLGQVVAKTNVEGSNVHQIDMSELASGVYVVKISSKNETFTQQVIKK